MKYQIRPMIEEDISEIIKGEEKIFGTSLGFDMIYSDLVLNPYANYLVLEIDKKVHGYIGLWLEDSADVINFYVDEEYQNLGFGTMLFQFAIELCQMSKMKSISLEVRSSNEKAKKLYKKFGLKEDHIRSKYYNDGEDAIVMIKYFEV